MGFDFQRRIDTGFNQGKQGRVFDPALIGKVPLGMGNAHSAHLGGDPLEDDAGDLFGRLLCFFGQSRRTSVASLFVDWVPDLE